MEFLSEWFNIILNSVKSIQAKDILDIAIIAFLIYNLIKLMRETRAEQLVKGLLWVVIAFALSELFHLQMLSTLLKNFFQFSVLALLILFQPELRRALEQVGRSNFGKYWSFVSGGTKESEEYLKKQKRCIKAVVDASVALSKTKTGALMVIERQTKLGDIIATGTVINALPSPPIIGNIFFNKAPLHDGAMIIREGMIYAAGCILPLTKNTSISIDLGTRHRAGVGISENSDAIVVIVSEETGTISMAVNGVLTRNYTREALMGALESALLPQTNESGGQKPIMPLRRKEKKHERKK